MFIPSRILFLPLLLLFAGCGQPPSQSISVETPNLFVETLGKSEEDVSKKVNSAFRQLFFGDPENERLYFEVGQDKAYIWDVGNDDVRSEGMSYGMMIAVQLDEKEIFDRLWRWTFDHMRHADGDLEGYYAWQCKTDGTIIAPGSASDGEEWFAMALFFASHRFGDGEGLFDYGKYANDILVRMLHKTANQDPMVDSIFDREKHIVRFVPWKDWEGVTDPSYHLPAFYELWAKWAEQDNEYWARCAEVSRRFFADTAHHETGLMPDYAYYERSAKPLGDFIHFRFDAWRTLSNVALDHAWWEMDAEWQVQQSNRVLAFLSQYLPSVPNQFSIAGEPLSSETSPGLLAMAATAAMASDVELGKPFVEWLWNSNPPTGHWRYYDGLLYLLAMLQVSGNFNVYGPN